MKARDLIEAVVSIPGYGDDPVTDEFASEPATIDDISDSIYDHWNNSSTHDELLSAVTTCAEEKRRFNSRPWIKRIAAELEQVIRREYPNDGLQYAEVSLDHAKSLVKEMIDYVRIRRRSFLPHRG